MHTACVWSEKLPFAGYSVVKDHFGALPRTRLGRLRVPPRSAPSRLTSPKGDVNETSKIFRASIGQWPLLLRRGGALGPPAEAGARQSRASKQSGEYRARTGDLLVANQALSQLS